MKKIRETERTLEMNRSSILAARSERFVTLIEEDLKGHAGGRVSYKVEKGEGRAAEREDSLAAPDCDLSEVQD